MTEELLEASPLEMEVAKALHQVMYLNELDDVENTVKWADCHIKYKNYRIREAKACIKVMTK